MRKFSSRNNTKFSVHVQSRGARVIQSLTDTTTALSQQCDRFTTNIFLDKQEDLLHRHTLKKKEKKSNVKLSPSTRETTYIV